MAQALSYVTSRTGSNNEGHRRKRHSTEPRNRGTSALNRGYKVPQICREGITRRSKGNNIL